MTTMTATADDWPTPDEFRDEMLSLAKRCDRAAKTLDAEADQETLDAAISDRKRRAAEGARQYAIHTRLHVEYSGHHDLPVTGRADRLREVQLVTEAAELGGISVDTSPMNDHDHNPVTVETQHRLVRLGWFEHIQGQIPYFQLVPAYS